MSIHIKPHLEAMLKAQVAAGNFPDLEAALEAAIMGLEVSSLDDEIPDSDLDWAKPFIDEGLADIAAGRTHSSEEVSAFIDQQMKAK